jgi:glycosyltransferase involved in cell wall biosynthesis
MKILLMGPLPPPYHGQSIAFATIAKQFEGRKHIVINLSNKNSFLKGLVLCLKIIFVVLFKKIDVIYFTCSRSFFSSIRDIVLLLCARVKKIRVINHLHGNTFYRFYHSAPLWYRPIVKQVYDWVDTTIVLLPTMKEQFKDFPKMKIKTVANCYLSELDELPLRKVKRDNTVKLLYLSNLMESKGIILLLEACGCLFQIYPNLSLNIAGTFIADEFSTQEQIKKRFENLYNSLKKKYSTQIDYKGIVSGNAKKELLWDSDIFILPTYYPPEAFPLSIIEAMRAGNCIISTTHNLIPEIITSENGTLIEPRSSEAIVTVLNDICFDKEQLYKIQNYNIDYAVRNYQESKYIEQVLSIIDFRNP